MKKEGRKIIIKRHRAEMNQSELSRRTGLSRTTISDWEKNGTDNAKMAKLRKLAKALNCKVKELI